MKYSAFIGEVVHSSGDSASANMDAEDVEFVEREEKCRNFGRLFESMTVVEETEVHRSCKQYPDLSQVVSAAHSAVGADDVLWRLEASRKGRDSTLPSAEVINDGRIGDSARFDQPASAAMVAPQPIFCEEIMKSTKSKEIEDIQPGNNKENCEVLSCPAAMRNSTEDRVKAGKTPEVELEMKTMKSSKVKKVKLKTKRTMKKLMTDRAYW